MPFITFSQHPITTTIIIALVLLALALAALKRGLFTKKTSDQIPTALLNSAQFKEIVARMGFTTEVVLHVAASVAQDSNHPLAKAIVVEAKRRKLPINAVNDFKSHTGYGLTGLVDGRIIALGSHALMQELGINTHLSQANIDAAQPSGTSIVYISINSYLAGVITFTRSV